LGDSDTVRPGPLSSDEAQLGAGPARVLLVEDNEALAAALVRSLRKAGYVVEHAADGSDATKLLIEGGFEAVVTDLMLPGTSGMDLLRTIRAYDLDLPVLLMTGHPTMETAIDAVELGALQYLIKPVEIDALIKAVARATEYHRLARIKREAMRIAGLASSYPGDRAGLESRFKSALETARMAFQPIVDLKKNRVYGYEALLRSREPSMPSPVDVVRAADQLGRTAELGLRVRELAVQSFMRAGDGVMLFLNIHTSDLLDPALFDAQSVLAPIASRVVLEVSEHSPIDRIKDARARASVLKFNGFRIAIDDLGAGYAGLTSFITLEPDIVKIDMALIRGIDASEVKQNLVRSIVELCGRLGMGVVAEGVETSAELHAVRMLGCAYAQGFFIGRPSDVFQPIDKLRV
jgi:EAL domain-containing protein (putative c-di-GMP-specific phosphodiesterase class I)/ActR/RegA family two-component response regulator